MPDRSPATAHLRAKPRRATTAVIAAAVIAAAAFIVLMESPLTAVVIAALVIGADLHNACTNAATNHKEYR